MLVVEAKRKMGLKTDRKLRGLPEGIIVVAGQLVVVSYAILQSRKRRVFFDLGHFVRVPDVPLSCPMPGLALRRLPCTHCEWLALVAHSSSSTVQNLTLQRMNEEMLGSSVRVSDKIL